MRLERSLPLMAVLIGYGVLMPHARAEDAPAPAGSTPTSTISPEVARLHAEAGRTYYQAGEYGSALDSFQRAYAVTPTAALAFNIARCHERLSQWKQAIEWYEVYVSMETSGRDKAEALDKIQALKKQLGPDAASDEGRYEARLQGGRQAYAKGDYETSIEEFKAAFSVFPRSTPIYNIAKAYEKLGRYEEAIDHFQQYLDLDPNATDRADVEETIRRLRKSIAERFQELTVNSVPPGAEIYLDDRNKGLQGQTNFRFKVTPGPHTLFLDLNGYEPVKREFIMPDDKPLTLDFQLKELENVGYLDIRVNKDGARIFVDGAIVGLSPYKQKKAMPAGPHQVTVEIVGYDRWNEIVMVQKDQTTVVAVDLQEYSPPISDDTLSSWGRNLVLVGAIGGTLGFVGPFAYEKLILKKDLYSSLGPRGAESTYRGPNDTDLRNNGELDTLKSIQLWSIVGGAVLVAGGMTFYFVKWFRPTPTPPVSAARTTEPAPWAGSFQINQIGVTPTEDGAAFGLSGSF